MAVIHAHSRRCPSFHCADSSEPSRWKPLDRWQRIAVTLSGSTRSIAVASPVARSLCYQHPDESLAQSSAAQLGRDDEPGQLDLDLLGV